MLGSTKCKWESFGSLFKNGNEVNAGRYKSSLSIFFRRVRKGCLTIVNVAELRTVRKYALTAIRSYLAMFTWI
jgi:hypothetical protein